jgi:hypothetical protein
VFSVPNYKLPRGSFAVSLATFVATGCTPEIHRYIRFPNLFHPGPAAHQRASAVEHDPFPENNIAPEIVGGRPLSYQMGVPEAERMTMNAAPPPGIPPTVVPGAPVRPLVGPTYSQPPTYPAPTTAPAFAPPPPPPIITTPYPPAASMNASPAVQQRSPY